jgi:uncharacterized protein with PQ loop repeat
MMHAETIVIVAFSITNIFRLFAYLPQIALILSDKDTSAVSVTTWLLFFASNGVTVLYAMIVGRRYDDVACFSGQHDLLRDHRWTRALEALEISPVCVVCQTACERTLSGRPDATSAVTASRRARAPRNHRDRRP